MAPRSSGAPRRRHWTDAGSARGREPQTGVRTEEFAAAGRSHRPGGRGPPAGGARQVQPRDCRGALHRRKTVASHLNHIFTKVGVSSRSAATAFAYEPLAFSGDRSNHRLQSTEISVTCPMRRRTADSYGRPRSPDTRMDRHELPGRLPDRLSPVGGRREQPRLRRTPDGAGGRGGERAATAVGRPSTSVRAAASGASRSPIGAGRSPASTS